ncbi:DNA helicase, partial [Tanacetum coccineum]
YEDSPPLIICKLSYQDIQQEKTRNRFPLKTRIEQNPKSYKGIRFIVEAIITSINLIRDWYYISCHQCGITTTAEGDNYTCLDHGPQPGPFFRYKFKGYITDTTATALVTFFSLAADKVTEHPCTDLVEKYKPVDPKKIPPEILAAQGKTSLFQFHLNTLGNYRDLNLDAIFDLKKQDENTGTSTQGPSKGTPSSASAVNIQSMEKQDKTQSGKEKCLAKEEGTTPPTYSTITYAIKKKGETEIAQVKSVKRTLFDKQATDPKKQKGD